MLSKSLIPILAAACAMASTCALADDKKPDYDTTQLPPASAKTGVTFAADIQPIFEKSCYPCHGPKTPKPKGKLRVDSLALILKGSEDGPVVTPGDIAKSPLLGNVAHLGDPDDYMPPPDNKAHLSPLTKEQIGLIRAWIEQGVK